MNLLSINNIFRTRKSISIRCLDIRMKRVVYIEKEEEEDNTSTSARETW
jgi:hypothetical protein